MQAGASELGCHYGNGFTSRRIRVDNLARTRAGTDTKESQTTLGAREMCELGWRPQSKDEDLKLVRDLSGRTKETGPCLTASHCHSMKSRRAESE